MIPLAEDEAEAVTVVVVAIESIHGLRGCIRGRIIPGKKMKEESETAFHDS